MKIKVFEDKKKIQGTYNVNSIKELIEKLKLPINEYIIVKNNAIVTESTELKENDEIKFLSVISGG